MKKYINRILIIFVLFVCLYCIKDVFGLFYLKITHLSEEDLEWVENKKGTYNLLSNNGRIAEMRIIETYINNNTGRFFISSAPGFFATFVANAGYRFDVSLDANQLRGWFNIKLNSKLYYSSAFNNLRSKGNGLFDDEGVLMSTTVRINDVTVADCIVVDDSNSESRINQSTDSTHLISKYIISKKFGVIYFKFDNGEEFIREFIVKRAKSIQQDTILSQNKDI